MGYTHYVDIKLNNERQNIRSTRSSGVHARASGVTNRKAVYLDGFFGFDGIPIGLEGRREDQRDKGRKRTGWKIMKFLKKHPLCVPYFSVAFIVGLFLQGWLHV